MEEQRSPEEMQKIAKIATDFGRYYAEQMGQDSEETANKIIGTIFESTKQESVKLIHIDEVLFMVMVRGAGVIEFHNINVPMSVEDMTKYIKKLVEKLKLFDVKVAFTYSAEDYYMKAVVATKLDWKAKKVRVKDVKKPIKVYILEL
jgi:hypothetical protein